MFLKLLKHDFMFSAKALFALGGLAFAVVIGFTLFVRKTGSVFVLYILGVAVIYLLAALGIACIVEICRFYARSFFGKMGYLTLTLPVSRGKQLVSKVVVSFAWFLLAMIAAFVTSQMASVIAFGAFVSNFSGMFNVFTLRDGVQFTTIAIFAICLLFTCITLAHSVFAGKRVHGIISGFASFLVGVGHFWILDVLSRRFRVAHSYGSPWTVQWYVYRSLVGLRYGRLPLFTSPNFNVYIDLYQIAVTIVFCTALMVLTHYLLKKRISLR